MAVGDRVRVEIAVTPNAAGQWQALEADIDPAAGIAPDDDEVEAEVEGYVTAFTSPALFSVGGLAVDASGVAALPVGLALGARVEVEGRLVDGLLIATKVEIEDEDDIDEDFEVEGTITALDPLARTFTVRGVVVDYSAASFEDGSESQLAVGVEVEVKGELAPDGVTLAAEEVKFEDD